MKIVIPNDYQDMVDKLRCFDLIRHHEVVRYREPAASFEELVARLADAALMVAARRNIALEAERMKRGDWPCTLSHRLRGSTLGVFGLGAIGSLVAEAGRGMGMKGLALGRDKTPAA